jgi:hypothetical protein
LENAGLMATICFSDNSDVKKEIEEKLFPHLENKDWRFYQCKLLRLVLSDVSVRGCRFSDLKK